MPRDKVHQLIIEKIEQLQSALFYPDIPDHLMPGFVLQEIKTDDQQQIWFAVSTPAAAVDRNYINFPCRMDFFRKGAAFHVKINGLATIMDEAVTNDCPLEIKTVSSGSAEEQRVVIKVQIQQAEMFVIPSKVLQRKNAHILNLVSNVYNKIAGQLFGKPLNPAVPSYS